MASKVLREMKDVEKAVKNEVRDVKKEIKEDKAAIRDAKADGASKKELKELKKELREDKKDYRNASNVLDEVTDTRKQVASEAGFIMGSDKNLSRGTIRSVQRVGGKATRLLTQAQNKDGEDRDNRKLPDVVSDAVTQKLSNSMNFEMG